MSFFHRLIRLFTGNKLLSNGLMLIVFIAAFLAIPRTPKQTFPDVSFQGFFISAVYLNASSSTIEKDICIPIENQLRGIENISKIVGRIKNHSCLITVHIFNNDARQNTLEKIQSRIDSISNYPKEAGEIKVHSGEIDKYIARVIISGDLPTRDLYNSAVQIKDELNNLGISDIKFEDDTQFVHLIEASNEKLKQHKITLAEIAKTIESHLNDVNSGSIDSEQGQISINALSSVQNINELQNIVLRAYPNGGQLKLQDIATIQFQPSQTNKRLFFDKKNAVSLVILQGGNKNIANVSKQLHDYINVKQSKLPKQVQVAIDNDISVFFNARISMLIENALFGLLLVFCVLLIFLNFRLALWVSCGIPIAIAGAMIVLYWTGHSINMISTFAFLLVLGIIVDDAIVVGENIYKHQQNFIRGTEGAISGAIEVSKPVLFSVLTTIIMFIPLLFIPGSDGVLVAAIPVVVIAALIFSLIESFFILPAHLSHQPKQNNKISLFHTINQSISSAVEKYIKEDFKKLIIFCLNWRYPIVAFFTALLFIAFGLLQNGWVNIKLLSDIEADEARVVLELPEGTPFRVTQQYIKKIEGSAQQIQTELKQEYGEDQIAHIRTRSAPAGDHTANVFLTFPNRDQRKVSTQEVIDLWRERVGPIDIATQLEYTASFNTKGANIDIQLTSKNAQALQAATTELENMLEQYPSVYQVTSNIKLGSKEVGVRLKDSAQAYNINPQQLALLINQAFHGIPVKKQGAQNSDFIIRLPESERNTLWHLEQLQITTPTGQSVPLKRVADLSFYTAPSEIHRYNYSRSLNIKAYVNDENNDTSKIMEDLETRFLSQIDQRYPGVSWTPSGQLEIKGDSKHALSMNFILALIAMFALLCFLFKSFAQSLIVLSAVPFGVVGALFGHWLLGFDVTIWSFAGIIAVSGIVVNDNVVLLDFINEQMKDPANSIQDAISEAGILRFRPILLTTLTTIIGVTPLIFENSWEAQFLIPMVTSIAFGELLATLVILVLVPCLFLIYQDILNFTGLKKRTPASAKNDF